MHLLIAFLINNKKSEGNFSCFLMYVQIELRLIRISIFQIFMAKGDCYCSGSLCRFAVVNLNTELIYG